MVAIIGIFLGVAVLSTDLVSFERRLEDEAQRLATRIRFTSEEALLQSRDYGIVFYEEGYEFLMFELGQGWLQTGGAGMEAFALEQDMEFRLELDEREVLLDERCDLFDCRTQIPDEDEEDEFELPIPQVIIFSTGEVTPFSLEFLRESEPGSPGYRLDVEFDATAEVTQGEV